jgi:sialate O-acetylesterase
MSIVDAADKQPQVALGSLFTDHMVLQHGIALPVWGHATPGERVVVMFAGQRKEGVTGSDGQWGIVLNPLAISRQPAELTVVGSSRIVITDVLVGEV